MCVHVKVFEAVGIANKAGSGVIVHLPTRKAQRLSPSQRLLHPLIPFLAHTARPDHSKIICIYQAKSSIIKTRMNFNFMVEEGVV